MARRSAPDVGAIEQGYRFLGGDPARPENWRALAHERAARPVAATLALLRRHGVPGDIALRMAAAVQRRAAMAEPMPLVPTLPPVR